MTKLQYLGDQAARAERIARTVTDNLTVERLLSFAAECRREMELLHGTRLTEKH